MRALRLLNINNGARLTARGMRVLDQLADLTVLRLEYDKLSDDGLRALGQLDRLQRLSLCYSSRTTGPIGNDEMRHLAGLRNLHELELRGDEITRDGLRHLAGLTNLRLMRIPPLPEPTDLDEFRQAVPACQVVESW